jgi:iron complex outermembrane receptor protein
MKKRILYTSLLSTPLLAGEITLQSVVVETDREVQTETKESINTAQKVDLSEALSQNIPEITLVRTSGVGNDIVLRGQQRDNLAVIIDDSTIYGACPNRMDPAIMHVSSSQVENVEVKEGVFDVSQFGSLAGTIKVRTREPKEGFGGEISTTYNSMDSKRGSINLEGGNDLIKANAGYSYETAEQYVDGDGYTFAEQVDNIALKDSTPMNDGVGYTDSDMTAYIRENWWLNLLLTPADNHKIKFGYFGDKATDVLYPVFAMDATKDETELFTVKYEGTDLADISSKFKINYFHSAVEHDMSNRYRRMVAMNPAKSVTHSVESVVDGVKVENLGYIGGHEVLLGVDVMNKSWDGTLFSDTTGNQLYAMIPDVQTKNLALYGSVKHMATNYDLTVGFRADSTKVEADRLDEINPYVIMKKIYDGKDSNDYSAINFNLFSRFYIGNESSIFAGVGQSMRVPNGKELYMNKVMVMPDGSKKITIEGNPDLKATTNSEVDLGVDTVIAGGDFTAKTFYSQLENFIYAYNNGAGLGFTNIDATIYGFDVSYSKKLARNLRTKVGVAYQRGEKDSAIDGQTDKDLAQIPPFKFIGNLHYFEKNYGLKLELIGASSQTIDEDNGEKDVDGYFVANIKGNYHFTKALSLNAGVDNIGDETYTLNNSYIGRGVNSTDTENIFVLNEAGRNWFVNLTYQF